MSRPKTKYDGMNLNMGAEAVSESSETIDISIDVNIISVSMGGHTEFSAPVMAAGTTHQLTSKYSAFARSNPLTCSIKQVTVGGIPGLICSPASLEAAVGDMVMFTFTSKKHTITQSSSTTPCLELWQLGR
ncbi:Cupredoxin [Lasallia pustulata]|uniref:Cupredoxin n=1 Tax=Lasallia pustulata TaxID=136370 RepID=A0A1W5DCL7_9LECA|nr:Cupredoxin [Lasallia pustulata]